MALFKFIAIDFALLDISQVSQGFGGIIRVSNLYRSQPFELFATVTQHAAEMLIGLKDLALLGSQGKAGGGKLQGAAHARLALLQTTVALGHQFAQKSN